MENILPTPMPKSKPLKQALKSKLTKKQLEILPASFDIVGDILIFADFPVQLKTWEKLVAEELMKIHKNVKVVCKKTKQYSGTFRIPKIKIIAGEKRKETVHKENNVALKLNVEKVYFSPRSSTERQRIARLIKKGESVLVMFSGCAPFCCVIAKNSHPKEVYGIEINPTASKYAVENILLNKLSSIKLFMGDVREIVPQLNKKFNRILMPLPKGAESFLNMALSAAKKGAVVHFYGFAHESEFNVLRQKVKDACKTAKKSCKIINLTKCGQFSPHVFRICIDFKVL